MSKDDKPAPTDKSDMTEAEIKARLDKIGEEAKKKQPPKK